MYDSEGRQHSNFDAALSEPEQAAGPSRPRMQPLPEEDIQVEERWVTEASRNPFLPFKVPGHCLKVTDKMRIKSQLLFCFARLL